MTFLEQFKAARRTSTPLIAIQTPDPEATIRAIAISFNGSAPPLLSWDASAGLQGINETGKTACSELNVDAAFTVNVTDVLPLMLSLPGAKQDPKTPGSIVCLHNIHRTFDELPVIQGLCNLRDPYKSNNRAAVMLGPSFRIPPELQPNIIVLDEPLPTNEQLAEIIGKVHEAAGLEQPVPETSGKAVDAVCGLASFPAEQATAMCLTKDGLNLKNLWDCKRKMVEQTPGLSFLDSPVKFEDVGGCENAKFFLNRVLHGNDPPRLIVFQDEIEKQFAGFGTDLSGTVTEQVGAILAEMENQKYLGVLFLGHPGAAKSLLSQAAGNEAGKPTVVLDASATKGSLVGQSGEQIRNALKVIRAVSQGKALFIGTCNSFGQLPPELKRRFRLGTFFFDLPTADERELIWQIHCKSYGVGGETPDDEGWTGAEIRNCCDIAWRLDISLKEASRFIVPYAKSNSDNVKRLRDMASGRFISANTPGPYRFDDNANSRQSRTINLDD